MNQLFENNIELLSILIRFAMTLPYFCLSTFLVVLTAVSLAISDSTKSNSAVTKISLFFHLLPLLCAPVIITSLTVKSAITIFGMKIIKSYLFLAFFGYIFHSYLGYFLLMKLFGGWKSKYINTITFCNNLNSKTKIVRYIVYIHELLPTCIFLFGIVLSFQLLMLSPSVFLSQNTPLAQAITFLHENNNVGIRVHITILIILLSISVPIMFYLFSQLVRIGTAYCLFAVKGIKRNSTKKAMKLKTNNNLFSVTIIILSSFIHLFVFLNILVDITSELTGTSEFEFTNNFLETIYTLLSPAVVCVCISVIIFLVVIYAKTKYFPIKRDFSKPILDSLALVPPAMYGLVGLLFVVNTATMYISLYICIIIYGYLLIRFLSQINNSMLEPAKNAVGLKLRTYHYFTIFLIRPVADIMFTAILTMMLVWMEHGIVSTIAPSESSLSLRIVGHKQSDLPLGVYYGVIFCFIIWGALMLVSLLCQNYRGLLIDIILKFVRKNYLSVERTTQMILMLLVLGWSSHSYSQDTLLPVENKQSQCTHEQITIKSNMDLQQFANLGCNRIIIHELLIDTNKIITFMIPSKTSSILIGKLIYSYNSTVLKIEKKGKGEIREFKIDQLESMACNKNIPVLQFCGIYGELLQIKGKPQNNIAQNLANIEGVNISFGKDILKKDSYFHRITISNLHIPNLNLQVDNTQGALVMLESISSNKVVLSGINIMSNTSSKDLELNIHNVSLYDVNPAMAHFKLQNVSITKGEIQIDKIDEKIQSAIIYLKEIELSTNTSPFCISTGELKVDLFIEQSIVNGVLDIEAPNINRISFVNIKETDKGDIKLKGNIPKHFILSNLKLDSLSLCLYGSDYLNQVNIQRINILNNLYTSEIFLNSIGEKLNIASQRYSLFKLFAQKGMYCNPNNKAIGLDAVYIRKKSELATTSTTVMTILDWSTGFGIRLWKPFCCLAAMMLIHVILGTWARYSQVKKEAHIIRNAFKLSLKSIRDIFYNSNDLKYINSFSNSIYKSWMRLASLLLYLGFTILCVYLSQTTLQ